MKWLPVVLFLLLLIPPGLQPGNDTHHSRQHPTADTDIPARHATIHVALLDAVIPTFTSPPEMHAILDGYTWTTGDSSHRFEVTWLTDRQVTAGLLDRFDVLIIPGIGKEYRRPGLLGSKWKHAIQDFVANGGGYFGTCGGANMAAERLVPPGQRTHERMTTWEWFMNASALGVAPVHAYQDIGDPIACSMRGQPGRIGQSAYIWYNLSIEGSGLCQRCPRQQEPSHLCRLRA